MPVGFHGEGGGDEVCLALDQRGYHAVDGAVRHEGAPVAVLAPVNGGGEVHLQPAHFPYFTHEVLRICQRFREPLIFYFGPFAAVLISHNDLKNNGLVMKSTVIPESIEHRWEYPVNVAPVYAIEDVAGGGNDLRGILPLTRIAG